MRLSELRNAAQMIGLVLEEGSLSQNSAEEILDLLYQELGRRLKV